VFLAKGGHNALTAPSSHGRGGGGGRAQYVPLVVVGNKTDRDTERVVNAGELRTLVDRFPNCCAGVETSAKRNHCVDEVRTPCRAP